MEVTHRRQAHEPLFQLRLQLVISLYHLVDRRLDEVQMPLVHGREQPRTLVVVSLEQLPGKQPQHG